MTLLTLIQQRVPRNLLNLTPLVSVVACILRIGTTLHPLDRRLLDHFVHLLRQLLVLGLELVGLSFKVGELELKLVRDLLYFKLSYVVVPVPLKHLKECVLVLIIATLFLSLQVLWSCLLLQHRGFLR